MTTPEPIRRVGPFRSVLRGLLAGLAAIVGLVVVLPLVIVAVPLWVVRGLSGLTSALARRLRPAETGWGELIEYEPEVGWKPRSGMDVYARAGGLYHLTTDREGWRGQRSLDEAAMVVVGDSFAFGHGADDDDLFTEFVPGVPTKSVGANGYNLVQSYLWMERLAPRLSGKSVVWFVFYENDLLENLLPYQQHYRMPFVRELRDGSAHDGWEIVTEHVSREPWHFERSPHYADRLAEICSPSPLSRRVFSAAEYLIELAIETCVNAGASLGVVGLPSPLQVRAREQEYLASLAPDPDSVDPRLPDQRLDEVCRKIGVPFLALSEHLASSDFLPDDCHWTPRGHRKVGRLLGGFHRRLRETADSRTRAPEGERVGSPSSAGAGSGL